MHNNRVNPSEQAMMVLLSRIVKNTGFWPSFFDARQFHYNGTEPWFYTCQKKWLANQEKMPPKRKSWKDTTGKEYIPANVLAEAEAVRQDRPFPLAEEKRYQGRPLEQPKLSPTVLALRDYRKAARNCGLSRARTK